MDAHDDKTGCIFPKLSLHAAVSCGHAPAAPLNGRRIGSTTSVGSTVTYTCNHGYSHSARVQATNRIAITCMANGSWNGSAPRCYGKLPYTIFNYIIITMQSL